MNRHRIAALTAGLSCLAFLGGCNVDSFFNPSVTGYWENQPTTIPILERIDAIERADDAWGQTSEVQPEDLIPNDLTPRIVPGDVVTVSVFELQDQGQWTIVTRRVDAGGYLRVPEVGEVPAAGYTGQEVEDVLTEILKQGFITRPQVDIVIEQSGGFTYTLYGAVQAPGQYTLINPDLRLLDGMASAGGVSNLIKNIYVIRQVALSEEVGSPFSRSPGATPAPPPPATPPDSPPVDIEDLIDDLDQPGDVPETGPGVLRQDREPLVDVDSLVQEPPPLDIDAVGRHRDGPDDGLGAWMFVEERGEWVRMPGRPGGGAAAVATPGEDRLFVERIIRIPVDRLLRGEGRYNIVIRPKDRIYVDPPPQGVIYVDGAIARPGTFNVPTGGITLSRLVAAAGGLGQLAIPERVDLIRMVGDNQESAIRLNLAAIRQRTEPDVLLKPNDHIIIGTSWAATPLAVIRNGFRATYGFGFLLDRNFGNDVFGAPPTNIQGR